MAIDDMTTATHYQRLWTNKKDWSWGAADGAGSRLAPNGATYWVFGDTILGYPSSSGTAFDAARIMVSNSIMVQRGPELAPATFSAGVAAVPDTVMNLLTRRFWIVDILFPSIYPGKCFALCQRLHDTGGGFATDGAMLAEFNVSGDTLVFVKLHETPTTLDLTQSQEIQWALAMQELGGYVYVYGFKDGFAEGGQATPQRTYVARVPVRSLTAKYAWQMWTGTGWVGGITATALENSKIRAAPIADGQLTSVRFQDRAPTGRWLFAQKQNFGFGAIVQIYDAPNPQGPLTLRQTVSSPGGTSPGGNAFITYNPTLHPQVALNSGQVLLAISHNGDFADIFDERTLYNPEFQEVNIPG